MAGIDPFLGVVMDGIMFAGVTIEGGGGGAGGGAGGGGGGGGL